MGGAFAVEGPSCTSSKMSPADTELDLIASTNFLCSVNRPIRLETTYRTAKENTRNLMVRMILSRTSCRCIVASKPWVCINRERCPCYSPSPFREHLSIHPHKDEIKIGQHLGLDRSGNALKSQKKSIVLIHMENLKHITVPWFLGNKLITKRSVQSNKSTCVRKA